MEVQVLFAAAGPISSGLFYYKFFYGKRWGEEDLNQASAERKRGKALRMSAQASEAARKYI
jgi:hypothetical protein